MSLKTKIEPIDSWVELVVNETLSPPARSKAVAEFARERFAEARDKNALILGRVPAHEQYVDGRRGAAFDSVNPDRGIIIVEFEMLTEVLRWIGRTLVERSPVRSGKYVEGQTLFADGQEVPLGGVIPPAEEYSFTNLVPYARKIEVGMTKAGRAFVIQVQPRIYQRTAVDARARFGNIAKIEFTFRGIVGGRMYGKSGARPRTGPKPGRESKRPAAAQNKASLRFPTIVIRPR